MRIQKENMGSGRIELPTSRLSGARSNHLSYEPISWDCQSKDCIGNVNRILTS